MPDRTARELAEVVQHARGRGSSYANVPTVLLLNAAGRINELRNELARAHAAVAHTQRNIDAVAAVLSDAYSRKELRDPLPDAADLAAAAAVLTTLRLAR